MYEDYLNDPIQSEFEMGMEEKGFTFITNLSPDSEWKYHEASKIHGIRYSIEDEAYGFDGNRVNGLKAFYVNESIGDLSDFWKTFEKLPQGIVTTESA